ncbi:hypothetical protein [Bacillus sp. SLBN-3]
MAFTYDGLIKELKQQQEGGLIGIHVPMCSIHYIEYSNEAGIPYEDYPTIQAYIRKAPYQEKRDVFESLGFNVLYMTLSAIKVIHFVEGRADGAPKEPSIDDAFLNNQRNVFILEVNVGFSDSLYFVIEYQSDDPLANYTVNREKLAEEKARKEKMRSLFNRTKK